MSKSGKTIQHQVQEQMPEFAEEVAGLSVDQLNDRLAQTAKDAEAVQQAKEADAALEEARATATELGAPYRDGAKAIRLKSRYLIQLINEKGGA